MDPFYLGTIAGGTSTASAMLIEPGYFYWYNYANDTSVLTSEFSFKAGQWVHVVFSYVGGGATPSNKSIYLNGQKYGSTQVHAGGVLSFNSSDCYLNLGGGHNATPANPFNGSIANFRLYDRPLSSDEITELYDYQKVYFNVISTSVMTLNNSGNIGIGTTSPSYKLHVAGDIYATGNITGYSDERAKSDIQKIENALEKIEKLNGYTFTMNNKRYTGMIAQEVLQVLPEAVVGTEETEYALAYGNMMGLVVEAIKEIKKKLDM